MSAFSKNIKTPMFDYISGDAFRSIARYTYDGKYYFGPKNNILIYDRNIFRNSPGDIIYVQFNFIESFINKIHPKIPHPYFLITHNADEVVDEKYLHFLRDPKIIKWFAINVDIDDEKIVPIPIGIQNREFHYKKSNEIDVIKRIGETYYTRSNLVYLNITPNTFFTERAFVLDFFSDKNFISRVENRNFEEFLIDLKSHTFCLSPSGGGLDCHRTWEALHMGCIPIIRPLVNPSLKLAEGFNAMFKDLPVIIVENWEEVTPEFLEEKLKEFKNMQFNYSKLYFSYWKEMILDEVRRFKSY